MDSLYLSSAHFLPCSLQPWPEEALERVADTFLLSLDMSESERQDVIPICKTFHTSAHTLSHRYRIFKLYVQRHKYILRPEMS